LRGNYSKGKESRRKEQEAAGNQQRTEWNFKEGMF
jgi:hypothetical protein